MRFGECLQDSLACAREADPDDPAVLCVGFPLHEASSRGPVDQLNCAVRAEQHVVGQIAYCRGERAGMTFDGNQQLMLDVRQAGSARLVLTPPLKLAQRDPELQQLLEFCVAYSHLIGWSLSALVPATSAVSPRSGPDESAEPIAPRYNITMPANLGRADLADRARRFGYEGAGRRDGLQIRHPIAEPVAAEWLAGSPMLPFGGFLVDLASGSPVIATPQLMNNSNAADMHQRAIAGGGELRLVLPGSGQVLEITDSDRAIRLYPTVAAAPAVL